MRWASWRSTASIQAVEKGEIFNVPLLHLAIYRCFLQKIDFPHALAFANPVGALCRDHVFFVGGRPTPTAAFCINSENVPLDFCFSRFLSLHDVIIINTSII